MIRFENVTKRFGDVVAVQDLTLDVTAGETVVLIGPSGCGKTTTLKMINRLIEPTSGRVIVNEHDVSEQDPQKLRRGIGYVIQSVGLFPHLTVRQNIQVVPDLLGWPKAKSAARADELLELIGLEPAVYRHRYPKDLSGGQQQRIGVARALAVDPPVLLMDEPFGAVDPITRERLQEEFLALQKRLHKTVVMVTHDIDEAIRMADRVCLMNEGRIEQYDTPDALLGTPRNRFVRQFVGSDRALKRLSRVRVGDVMDPVAPVDVKADSSVVADALRTEAFRYVVDEGRLVGWVTRRAFREAGDLREAITEMPRGEALTVDDDVRDAVAKMLGQGVAGLPVVEGEGALVGQFALERVVKLAAPSEDDG
ncbi:MAG: ABC transporter ATP-binding protein [Trueperaceae bacterium]